MIIGKYSSYIGNTDPCKEPDSSSRFYRYVNSMGGKRVTGYGSSCEAARQDWYRLTSKTAVTLPPAKGNRGHTTTTTTYQPKVVSAKGNWITGGGESTDNTGGGGQAGAMGVAAGSSIKATVSNITTKTNQAVSDIIPDTIEEKIPESFPLWMLPVGLIGGLVLILLLK